MKSKHKYISILIMVILPIVGQSNTIKSENEQYTLSGYVTNSCTGYELSASTIVATGTQQYTAVSDNNGYYELIIDNGTYNVEFIKSGFDTARVLNLPVASNIQIDAQLVGINYAPINIVATLDADETICYLSWDMPFSKSATNKNLIGFTVARVSNFSPCNDPTSGIITPLSGPYNSYSVANWSSGYYSFAVKAIYDCGESSWSYSNTFSIALGKEVVVNIDICSINQADSTSITLTGKNCPWNIYSSGTDSVGNLVLDNITLGNYDIQVISNGYSTFNLYSVPVINDTIISIELTQNMLPPVNMYVDSSTNTALWEKPMISPDSAILLMYNIFIDGILIDSIDSETQFYTFLGLIFEQTYNTCIEAVYTCGFSEQVCYTWKSQLLSVNNNSQNNPIVIYPIPAVSDITITSASPITNIRITNYVGQEVFNKPVNGITNHNVVTSNFQSGVYIVEITTVGKVFTKKIIIAR